MQATNRLQDISDKVWGLLETHLPGREDTQGVTSRDNRNFLDAVFWDTAKRCAVARPST